MRPHGPILALLLCLAPAALAADDVSIAAIGAICSAEHDAAPAGAKRELVMLGGVGTGGFPIATAKPEAQLWFDYGMKLAHAFYHEDAKAAFRRARAVDPACAMCVWGEAWADGPTINYDTDAKARKAAGAIVQKAAALVMPESAKNRALIEALRLRYAGPGPAADLAYAKAMDALSRLYPEDDEVAIMTSDAWLEMKTQHSDGQGVARAVAVLEPVLKRHPDNTGAIHFYIHATEVAGDAALALPYADRLGALAPAASHLVHMASHTFFRVGRYEDAAVANARAIAADGAWLRANHDASLQGKVVYHAHDLRFGLAGAMASGDGPLAVRLADHAAFAFPTAIAKDGEFSLADAEMAYGRYAPARALALRDPGNATPFAAAMRHYARGEAFARQANLAGVRAEAAALGAAVEATDGAPGHLTGKAMDVARVAELTLRGRAAMIAGRPRDAVGLYRAAAAIQDGKLSGEYDYDPPPWWYPERRAVAAALLAAGDAAGAVREARTALKAWPNEPLTLQVLSEAERAAGDAPASARDLAAANAGWRGGAVPAALM